MEGEKKNTSGWYRGQYSRNLRVEKYGTSAGQKYVEREGTNYLNKPAQKHRQYYRRAQNTRGRNIPGFQFRTNHDLGRREIDTLQHGGRWHHWEKKAGHYAKNYDNTEDEAEEDDLEYHTAEEGDSEEENSSKNDEAENRELQLQILRYWHNYVEKAHLGCLEDGEENESTGGFKPNDQQENLKLRVPATTESSDHVAGGSSEQAHIHSKEQQENEPKLQLPVPQNVREHQRKEKNIRFPIPKNLRGYEWLMTSTKKFELGTRGYSYDGGITDQKMHGYGRLMLNNEGDFIAGNWEENLLIDLKSCQLHYRQKTFNLVKRFDDYLLTMYESHLVATVMINCTDQLDFNNSIWQLKEAFFGNLTTLEILQDELKYRRQESLYKFECLLNDMTSETTSMPDWLRATVLLILLKYSSNYRNTILSDFINDQLVPPDLKHAASDVQTRDSEYRSSNNSFIFLKTKMVQLEPSKMMAKVYKDGIEKHRNMLINGCPSSLPSLLSQLQNLDGSLILYATRADIDAFYHLANQPFFQHYKECIENLVKRYGKRFNSIKTYTYPSTVIPIMSPVLEFLVRSLWDIISEIIEAADGYTYESMLKCELGNWKIEEKINWAWATKENNCNTQKPCQPGFSSISENNSSLYHRSLEVQYKVVLGMLTHFFPDNPIFSKRFEYNFHVLEQDSSWRKGDRKAESWLQKQLQKYRKTRGLPERFKDLSEERIVWLYILDHTIHEVFKDDPKYQDVLKQYNPLLQGTVQFILSSPTERQESFRALIHKVVKLITSSAPYMRGTMETAGVDVELDNLGIDVELIFQHISTASQNIDHDQLVFSHFRDLITEYNKYLSLRHFIKTKAAPGYFSTQLSQMMQTFMRIVGSSLKKSVPTAAMVVYFRCLNDFLDDFRNIDFLAMWYVKTLGYENLQAMKKVDNKLSSGKSCSYCVTNIEKFVAECHRLDLSPPRHYIIEIVNGLLGCIEKCLSKQWESNNDDLQLVQLKTTGLLLDAIRRSFMYLKEQPDYVDFKAFKKESVEPFVRLIEECSTMNDLQNRTNIVKESFWYLRKMDEIDIDQALTLFNDLNTCRYSDKLSNCYNLYIINYTKYIEKYSSVLSDGKSHSEGLNAVKQMLKQPNPLQFSRWTGHFKTKEIPILLAGLSAIWSILVSKDLSSSGKFLKPHCIQILCILRLLSVDQSRGTDNHLAQVLTGQGKSVILGLLSSILALTGHNVRVLCYSEYLSSRDQNDFWEFFRTFQITSKINYGTFERMALDFLNPTCNGIKKSLSQLVTDRVRYHTDWSKMVSQTTDPKNSVLLIDEVDVFFTENFYGNTCCSGVRIEFRGLVIVQEKIWSLAMKKQFTKQMIVNCIENFIRDEAATGNKFLLDLNAFLSEPGEIYLLDSEGRSTVNKRYTNQTLFDEHLHRMISDAISVAAIHDDRSCEVNFMINNEGIICGIPRNNNYINNDKWRSNNYWGYHNTFNYFRLKGSNYDHKNFQNYGYLLLETGNISYSRLPSKFRLILGVSGTIKNLSEYEKTGIKSYNIHNSTILPSFYGESHLLFNKETDFHYYTEEQEWLKKIYNKADRIVQVSRAVLIFFESDITMDLFTKEYRNKFDRLNEITANTDPHLRDTYIEESGLPGAVTLATRSMGRGVDYKSSLSVEKHGGVHVIQTFYSTDIKEEIQIKGRTARKDNKGSYEIVVCKEHLISRKIIPAHDRTAHNYATMDEIRQKLSNERGKTVTEKIEQSELDHKTTMEYFGLA